MRFIICVATLVAGLSVLSAGQVKIKDTRTGSIVVDKSKPIRRGLEAWYAQNSDGFRRKDLASIMALRTDDFHTLTPDGRRNDYAFMTERTKLFLDRIVEWISLRFEIGTIQVEGPLAWAYITQDTVRMQRLGDGTIHKVRAKAIQRETFRLTPQGWRLHKVDDIKDLGTWVDDRRIMD